MSTKDPNPNPGTGVDPSERNQGGTGSGQDKEKDNRPEGKDDSTTDAPKTASKGINPVQHSE